MARQRAESSTSAAPPAALVPEAATESVMAKVNEEMAELQKEGLGLGEAEPTAKRVRADKPDPKAKAKAKPKETAAVA